MDVYDVTSQRTDECERILPGTHTLLDVQRHVKIVPQQICQCLCIGYTFTGEMDNVFMRDGDSAFMPQADQTV